VSLRQYVKNKRESKKKEKNEICGQNEEEYGREKT
jgi:hypothetical protein